MIPPPHSASCTSASGVFAPVATRKTPPVQSAEGQDQHQYKLEQDEERTCNYNCQRPDQDQHGTVGVPNAAINATCIRPHHLTFACSWYHVVWYAMVDTMQVALYI